MTAASSVTKARILLVEDNPDDAYMIERALRAAGPGMELHVAKDGVAALEHLRRCVQDGRKTPEIILLDINMPGLNGFETLAEIRSDPRMRLIPVVMLSTSGRIEDIARGYESGACSYLIKPPIYSELESLCAKLLGYWYGVTELPPLN